MIDTLSPQKEKFMPAKYFSIDRVFRNETLDATHLAEFHQIEGVVADYGLTLGDLMGTLQEFFTKLGEPGGGGRSLVGEGGGASRILGTCRAEQRAQAGWKWNVPGPQSEYACGAQGGTCGLAPPPLQDLLSCVSSQPTIPTRNPAWRCSATTKVRNCPLGGWRPHCWRHLPVALFMGVGSGTAELM